MPDRGWVCAVGIHALQDCTKLQRRTEGLRQRRAEPTRRFELLTNGLQKQRARSKEVPDCASLSSKRASVGPLWPWWYQLVPR